MASLPNSSTTSLPISSISSIPNPCNNNNTPNPIPFPVDAIVIQPGALSFPSSLHDVATIKPSFVNIAAVKPTKPILEEFKPDIRALFKDGMPVIYFSSLDLSKAAGAFNTTLVMSFPSVKPKFRVSEIEVTRALSRESRQIKGLFYKLARWTVDFNPKKDSIFSPIWIGLVLHLQNNEIVKELAGLVGKYLITNTTTLSLSRPNMVQVCVEANLMKKLPTKMGLAFNKSFIMEQTVLYERLLRFCTHCVLQGHNKASCTKLHPILITDKREEIKHGKVSTMGTSGQSHNNISLPQMIKNLEPVKRTTKTELHTVGLKIAMARQTTLMTMGQIAAPTAVANS
ncbi:hypothetical protein GIB67_041549 [Kingdonia uniflora]|uniref:DUF4283 domain-containing protein n=1 Tax=Kingdonia uniflora TaxID=39325 RepID=A0A7J7MQT8_9MAGN|nr:hypothetical protein GIB67_041549 [Kingdonia uniflora]